MKIVEAKMAACRIVRNWHTEDSNLLARQYRFLKSCRTVSQFNMWEINTENTTKANVSKHHNSANSVILSNQ